jgi:hypothetical protein
MVASLEAATNGLSLEMETYHPMKRNDHAEKIRYGNLSPLDYNGQILSLLEDAG